MTKVRSFSSAKDGGVSSRNIYSQMFFCPWHSRIFPEDFSSHGSPLIRRSFTSFDLDRSGEVWRGRFLREPSVVGKSWKICWSGAKRTPFTQLFKQNCPFAVVLRCIKDQNPRVQCVLRWILYNLIISVAELYHVHDLFSAGLTSTCICVLKCTPYHLI